MVATRGLPGSGKTTWARRQQEARPTTVLVSRDELRALLHGGRYSEDNERQVVAVRDAIVADALRRGRDVIVHDTNLDPRSILALEALGRAAAARFSVQDFTGVALAVCLARDAARPHPVGEAVIRAMWRDHLAPAAGQEP